MQGEESFYCSKVNDVVRIQFNFLKMEDNGFYRTERVLSNQKFNCERYIAPEHCPMCSPMTRFDIWEKLIKHFVGKN